MLAKTHRARVRPVSAPSVSVIVTTYNWPAALDRVLDSLGRQTRLPREVIVADDGSREDTARLVADWAARFPIPLLHSWQEDKGFRLARSRNLALARATGDYIVFIDGDCIALPDFVARHAAFAAPGRLVTGRRVFLRDWFSRWVIERRLRPHRWPFPALVAALAVGARNRPQQILPLPLSEARRTSRAESCHQAEGANLGFWRADLEAVGGFDERYERHGPEDRDLIVRLFRTGLRRYRMDHVSPLLHLAHARPSAHAPTQTLFEELLASDRTLAIRSLLLDGQIAAEAPLAAAFEEAGEAGAR